MPGKVSVNGTSKGSGHSISISGGKMLVDGREYDLGADQRITIEISGDVADLVVGACEAVHIEGSVGTVSVNQGNVRCGNVGGSVSAMSGDVNCGAVAGPVSSMGGNINHR